MSLPPGRPDFVAVDWNGTVVPFFSLPPYPGALDTLHELRASGLTVIVLSSASQRAVEGDVARVGLEVDEVIGSGDKARALVQLRSRYGQGMMLGDHPADLRAAREAGVCFVQARLEGPGPVAGCDGAFTSWGEAAALLLRPV